MKTKKFTILHSNDMHGDFLIEPISMQYQNSEDITQDGETNILFKALSQGNNLAIPVLL